MDVNLYEAETKFSELVERAMLGEAILLAKAGKPMVSLVRLEAASRRVLW